MGGPSGVHRTNRTAVNAGGVAAGIEPPVIDRISRQARRSHSAKSSDMGAIILIVAVRLF